MTKSGLKLPPRFHKKKLLYKKDQIRFKLKIYYKEYADKHKL